MELDEKNSNKLKKLIEKKKIDTEEDDDFEEKRRMNTLLKLYKESLPDEILLIAIKMYEDGKSYVEIEKFLKLEQERIKNLGKLDYYGGRSLKQAREEIDEER